MKKLFLNICLLLSFFLVIVKVDASEFINRIDINYDESKVKVHPYYTYNQVKNQISNAWTILDDAPYSKGDNDIWMYYCNSSELCDNYNPGYNGKIDKDKLTLVSFGVYANPYEMNAKDPDYDFDKDNLSSIEIYVNGIKREDAFIDEYYSTSRRVDVFVPLSVSTDPFVLNVKITNSITSLKVGDTYSFKATAESYGEGYDGVTFSISGNNSEETIISSSGVLYVSEDETSSKIVVKATSIKEENIYDLKEIDIIREEQYIESVNITNKVDELFKGQTYLFKSNVEGTASKDIIWSVTGNMSTKTQIDNLGNLVIDENENAKNIYIKATSKIDNSKYDSLTVFIKDRIKIEEVNIIYDESKAPFNIKYTHNEWETLFKSSVINNDYYKVDNNSSFLKHFDGEIYRQTNSTSLNNDYISLDREYGLYLTITPLDGYYFDSENYQNIDIKVNNEKVLFIEDITFNSYYKTISIFYKMTPSDAKAAQSLYFNMETFNSTYGNIFTNKLFHQIGDGEVTYYSENPSIATIDEHTGQVTTKSVGETTIYAVASETDEFLETKASYKLLIGAKNINPIVSVENITYTGEKLKPNVTVNYGKEELLFGRDYTLFYDNNINVGKGNVTVSALSGGLFTFLDKTVTFTINKKELLENNLIVKEYAIYDDGNEVKPSVTVKSGDRTLVSDEDYIVSYEGTTNNIGEYITVTIEGINNYSGIISKQIIIKSKEEVYRLITPYLSLKQSNDSVTLTWAVEHLEETYYIERSTDNKKWKKIATTTLGKYKDKNLTYNKTYYYRIYAKNFVGKTEKSNVLKAVIKPNKVNNLKVTSASTNNIKLSWDKVSTTGYEIRRSTDNKKWSLIKTITKNSTVTFNNTYLSSNKTYYYKVRAYKTVSGKKIYGKYSNIISTKTAPLKSKISVKIRNYNSLKIKITSSKGASKYKVYRSTSKNGTYKKVMEVFKDGTYKDLNLTTGRTYYYKVKACNKYNNCSSYSNIESKKVIPSTPDFTLSSKESKKVKIDVLEVAGSTKYEIYRSTSKYGKYNLVKSLKESNLTLIDSTKKGKTYYYKVRCYVLVNNKKVYSNYSSIKSIKSK